MEVSLSVPSINNIVGLFAGILPSYLVNNKTLDINYTQSGFGYNIFIEDLHINTLNINTREIFFVQDTQTLRVLFGGIDLDSDMDGTMTIIGIIPMYAAKLKLTNLTVQVDLTAVPMENDTVRWQLQETSFIDFSDIQITTTSSVWNAMINTFHGTVKSIVKSYLPQISHAISGLVDSLNAKMANGTSFMTNVFDPRFPLNLTTTMPPQADTQNKVITLNFDGTFYDSPAKTNHVRANSVNPQRIAGMNSNQVFLHQSMLASLMMVVEQEALPARLNDTNTTNQILQLFPEIKYHYGETIETQLFVDLSVQSGDFLTVSALSGIEIGKNEKAQAHL